MRAGEGVPAALGAALEDAEAAVDAAALADSCALGELCTDESALLVARAVSLLECVDRVDADTETPGDCVVESELEAQTDAAAEAEGGVAEAGEEDEGDTAPVRDASADS